MLCLFGMQHDGQMPSNYKEKCAFKDVIKQGKKMLKVICDVVTGLMIFSTNI